jgi:hypothetical protein
MWISFLVYRRAIQREKPLLIARLAPIKDQLGWFQMDLRLESRSSHGWRCNAIRFLTWGACGIAWGDAHGQPNLYGDRQLLNPLPVSRAKKSLALNLEVTRAEVPTPTSHGLPGMGLGDTHSVTLFVSVPHSKWLRALFMRATLHSIAALALGSLAELLAGS